MSGLVFVPRYHFVGSGNLVVIFVWDFIMGFLWLIDLVVYGREVCVRSRMANNLRGPVYFIWGLNLTRFRSLYGIVIKLKFFVHFKFSQVLLK